MTPFDKFTATRNELSTSLIEREQEIDLVLTALVAQEHVLLVGEPGTGKTMLSDALVAWLSGKSFTILLQRFTTPEEVFGPLSLSALKNDKYKRIPTNKMPEADIAYLDEIFNASSAILNTMLKILNERIFINDDVAYQCPLKLCIGSSNLWPGGDDGGGKELGALFDRFLFRRQVRAIGSNKSLETLLWTPDLSVKLSTQITPAEIDLAQAEAKALTWDPQAKDNFRQILREAKSEGICPGDRRLRKSVKACQAFAWLNGGVTVESEHLEILGHVLWDDPQEQPKKIAEIVGRIANPSGMKINSFLMEAEEVIQGIDMKDMAKLSVGVKKLSSIHKELSALSGSRAKQAVDHVKSEIDRIKMASLASV